MIFNDKDEYIGPGFGTVLVHKRIIPRTIADSVFNRELDSGIKWVSNRIGCIHRVGCNCCYKDGPDLKVDVKYDDPNNLTIEYSVNFDFIKE